MDLSNHLLVEQKGQYLFVVYQDSVDIRDITDPSVFESDEDLAEYYEKYDSAESLIYFVCVYKNGEIVDSLGGIDEDCAEKALDLYLTSYANESIQDCYTIKA